MCEKGALPELRRLLLRRRWRLLLTHNSHGEYQHRQHTGVLDAILDALEPRMPIEGLPAWGKGLEHTAERAAHLDSLQQRLYVSCFWIGRVQWAKPDRLYCHLLACVYRG